MSIVGKFDIVTSAELVPANPIEVGDWVEISAAPPKFTAYKGTAKKFSVDVTISGNTIKADARGSDNNYYYITAHTNSIGGIVLISGAILRKTGADDDGGQWDGNRRP